jgi:cytochrome c oxidase subunit I+III
VLLELDRTPARASSTRMHGGNSLLWQHLFWFFGHPEVYIMFLPATGIVSMVVAVFAQRRLVGYTLIAVAIVVTGFVSFGLWVHHMFTTGCRSCR